MSSHLFDEIDQTCERAAIIREGELVAVESIRLLKAALPQSFVVTMVDKEGMAILQNSTLNYIQRAPLIVEIFIKVMTLCCAYWLNVKWLIWCQLPDA